MQQALNKSLLQVTQILDRSESGWPRTCVSLNPPSDLSSRHPSSAIELLTTQPTLVEQLRRAHMGNYQIVLSLLSSLDNGRSFKRLVDQVIDACNYLLSRNWNRAHYRR